MAAIEELQSDGYPVPDYPEDPKTTKEKEIRARYNSVKGSAVNPVLREGNSDRRAPQSVKNFAKQNPHRMGKWSNHSKSHVAHMSDGDFYGSEKSIVTDKATTIKFIHEDNNGKTIELRAPIDLQAGEVFDAAVLSYKAVTEFFSDAIDDAKAQDVLMSVHLKATMMKVSDPIIFGHAVRAYYQAVYEKHAKSFEKAGISPNNGVGEIYSKLDELPADLQKEIKDDIEAVYKSRPPLAMVNSDKGITNLHVPSDVIIDASMPAAMRTSGQMWGPDGELKDTKFCIPDRAYARKYQVVIEDCIANGAFDPTTMGTVQNIGLMAQKAEEYGSHDKTFEIASSGIVRIINNKGKTLITHKVEAGDIWRGCQTKDAPIKDWVKLAVSRARLTGLPIVFWLDRKRAHDANLINKVYEYLPEFDIDGLDVYIMSPVDAMHFTLDRVRKGQDTIAVTGNVLRDYLTDLFPILELGTSAKMLSIVPLMNGGGLFETGAGGSAPKHVQQFTAENHLRWNSLGEFLALSASLEHLSQAFDNKGAETLGKTLDEATGRHLTEDKGPSRKVKELDNRGSHYYLATYWARALSKQKDDKSLAKRFAALADALEKNESTILEELNEVQGSKVEMGGYYSCDKSKLDAAMRPSKTFSKVLSAL